MVWGRCAEPCEGASEDVAGVLGFDQVVNDELGAGGAGAVLLAEVVEVGLVEDLAGLTSTLRKAGYSISDDVPLEGYNRIFVHDPFGNRIELLEVVPSSS